MLADSCPPGHAVTPLPFSLKEINSCTAPQWSGRVVREAAHLNPSQHHRRRLDVTTQLLLPDGKHKFTAKYAGKATTRLQITKISEGKWLIVQVIVGQLQILIVLVVYQL